ncbi:MAG: hypothetical protein ABIP97_10525 [Chthoniobacterales bacterium]
MKILQAILALASLAFINGCAVAEQSTEDVGRQFQQGVTGKGKIVSDAPMSDSFGSDYH